MVVSLLTLLFVIYLVTRLERKRLSKFSNPSRLNEPTKSYQETAVQTEDDLGEPIRPQSPAISVQSSDDSIEFEIPLRNSLVPTSVYSSSITRPTPTFNTPDVESHKDAHALKIWHENMRLFLRSTKASHANLAKMGNSILNAVAHQISSDEGYAKSNRLLCQEFLVGEAANALTGYSEINIGDRAEAALANMPEHLRVRAVMGLFRKYSLIKPNYGL
jgi:hypothetical protein